MKLHELFETKSPKLPKPPKNVTIARVSSLGNLKSSKTGEFQTGEINVTRNVALNHIKIEKFPVKFGKINGNFSCVNCELTSLVGAPSSVDGDFLCNHNKLTSLEGAPNSIGGGFICNANQLTSLEGAPSSIGALSMRNDFACDDNKLTSLEGIHKIIKHINGQFWCNKNPIKSGGIGLILIEGLTEIMADQPAFDIINKYLGQGKKGLLYCQDELIEAGYEEYARL